jgi:N-formylglutamate deformylase
MVDTASPVVIHVPHASILIPEALLASYAIPSGCLAIEILRMTDRFTDELFDIDSDLATHLIFPVSRLVIDPERFDDDDQEPISTKGMGAVYTKTSDGQTLRLMSPSLRKELMDSIYYPHHKKLFESVENALAGHGACLIIDAHSFASKPLPHEFDQHPHRPDICIGTDAFHTPPWLTQLATSVFASQGFHVEVDRPFAGSIVSQSHYRRDPRVRSIMIEINRALYMCEESGGKLPAFPQVAAQVQAALMDLIAQATATGAAL